MKCHELYDNVNRLEQKELEAWVNRFEEAERVMGAAASDALKKLYNYYGKDFLLWLARLYDPETGCFYYSNSARDNEGFLPDCESTAQTLSMFKTAGLLSRYGNDCVKAFPEDMVTRCREYLQSLQSEEDGYFYHPQWGKGINSSRRGRDLTQCIEIIRKMGGEPKYPTAIERLNNAKNANGIEKTVHFTGLPDYMRSEEAMIEKLKSLGINRNSYSAGHWISSQTDQLIAAGLGDAVCDYLDSVQNTETGLWEEGATYNSVSGVIKIGAFYNRVPGRIMKHTDKIIESCIEVILSDEDTLHMCLVFNPHGALHTAISSLVRRNEEFSRRGEPEPYDIPALRALIFSRFPEMVDVTIEKLNKFRCPDGSFSYFQAHCAAMTQGTLVAKRCKEGDVNATICAVLYPIGAIFGYLGISVVPLANAQDFEVIREIIETAEPVKKIPEEIPYQVHEDYQNYGLLWRSSLRGKYDNDCGADPIRVERRAYRWTVPEGERGAYSFDGQIFLSPPEKIDAFRLEYEFFIPTDTPNGERYELSLTMPDGRAAYTVVISVLEGDVILSDKTARRTESIAALGRVGEWLRLTVCYYPMASGATVKLYRGDELIKSSDNTHPIAYTGKPYDYVTGCTLEKVTDDAATVFVGEIKIRYF